MSIDLDAIKARIAWTRDTLGAGPFVPNSIYGEMLAMADDLEGAAAELERLRTLDQSVRAETLIEAADEVHNEARWQQERQMRNVRPVNLDPVPRLLMIEQILRDRAAAQSPSVALSEPSGGSV